MKRASLRRRLTYWFNNLLSRGATTLVIGLFLFTLIVIVAIGLITSVVEEDASGTSPLVAIWQSFNHTLDAGTLAGDDGSVSFIALMTAATIFGLIFTSTLVGIINNGISEKLETLDKGRSLVLEEGHTIILGYNDTALSIVRELLLSNLNQRHCCIVIMDNRDKTEMADAIHVVWNDVRRTHKTRLKPRFVCRSGRIDSPLDLAICSPASSKSIIINTTADCTSVKVILAASRCLETEVGTARAHGTFICAVALRRESVAPLRIASNHAGEILYFRSILARMAAQTIRRPGISKVFSHLLDFEGNEIYVEHVDMPQGTTFGQASRNIENATVLGVMRDGRAMLNPPNAERITSRDQLILIAEDDGVARYGTGAPVDEESLAPLSCAHQPRPITLLVLGTNSLTPDIVSAADTYGTGGSRIIVAADGEKIAMTSYPSQTSLLNIDLEFQPCDIFDRTALDSLIATLQPDNILVMSDEEASHERADAQTLMLLLQLRDIKQTSPASFMVTCELRDSANQCLAEATDVTDFIISDRITALMMAQVSETRTRRPVIDELLADSGKEIYLKPMGRYVKPGSAFTYATLKASARRYDEIALGYKRLCDNDFDIVLNPANDDIIHSSARDMAIILADNPLE